MTKPDPVPTGALLRTALALRPVLAPLAPWILRRRLRRGKEDPSRWREKLGEATLPRPGGPLIWLNAVGLGEVLALRGLISAMAARRPDATFLVTSTTRASAGAFARQAPERALHQFLPLDLPGPVTRFLDHWRPDLSVWAEQDLWPGLVVETARRGVPLAMVNARMNDRAFRSRSRAKGLFRDLYARVSLIDAQDAGTVAHLRGLGAQGVTVSGSLKPGAGALSCDVAELDRLRSLLAGRRPWLAASTHPADEALAFAAAVQRPDRPLIIAPRYPARGAEIAEAARAGGLHATLRSAGQGPEAQVWIVDTFGEMGLWYRLCDRALIGGQDVGGHSPWEAAHLGCAILHGGGTANFADDYAMLAAADAARNLSTGDELAAALDADLSAQAARALVLTEHAEAAIGALADRLLALLTRR